MIVFRSFPFQRPGGRPYVEDSLTRLVIQDYDYAPLNQFTVYTDGIIIVEWDIAIAPYYLEAFTQACQTEPGRVRVAPYLLSTPSPLHYAHRRVTEASERWVNQADAFCEYFGFGCIYLPSELIRRFLASDPRERGGNPPADTRFTDQTFSYWYYHTGHGPVPIEWSIPLVHLH